MIPDATEAFQAGPNRPWSLVEFNENEGWVPTSGLTFEGKAPEFTKQNVVGKKPYVKLNPENYAIKAEIAVSLDQEKASVETKVEPTTTITTETAETPETVETMESPEPVESKDIGVAEDAGLDTKVDETITPKGRKKK